MRYLIGGIFLLISIWQFIVTGRTFSYLKKEGGKRTSPFILLGLWSSLVFAIISFAVAIASFFYVSFSRRLAISKRSEIASLAPLLIYYGCFPI